MTRRVNSGEQSDAAEKLVSSDAAGGQRVFLRVILLSNHCAASLCSLVLCTYSELDQLHSFKSTSVHVSRPVTLF